MDADKSIEKIMGIFDSLQTSIDGLQEHADKLNEAYQPYIPNDQGYSENFVDENQASPELVAQLQEITNHISDKTSHIENIMTNMFNPDMIAHRLNTIKLIEERKKYWMNHIRDNQNGQ